MARRKEAKLDPRSFQASEAVLGSILLHAPAMAEVDLIPEDFDFEWQRLIFTCMQEMASRKEGIDVVTVSERLQAKTPASLVELPNGGTWMGLLSQLMQETPTWRNISSYAKIVKDRAVARAAAKVGSTLSDLSSNDVEQVDTAIRDLMALRGQDRKHSMRLSEALSAAVEEIDKSASGEHRVGIATGITKLDSLIGGLAPGHLIVIGARPAMGKTSFGLQLLLNNPQLSAGFMSTEMPTHQLAQRACATVSGVSSHAMRMGKLLDSDWPKISTAMADLAARPIYVNDRPYPTPFQVVRQARQWKFEQDIKLLVVDYIQHLKIADVRDKTSLLAEAVVGFKELGRELNIPVVLLAQINRGVESRADKRPNLGDFKDTGALEEEGDIVMAMYRDEVYNPKTVENKGILEIAVLKNRHGPTAWFKTNYNAACFRIENIIATADAFE